MLITSYTTIIETHSRATLKKASCPINNNFTSCKWRPYKTSSVIRALYNSRLRGNLSFPSILLSLLYWKELCHGRRPRLNSHKFNRSPWRVQHSIEAKTRKLRDEQGVIIGTSRPGTLRRTVSPLASIPPLHSHKYIN